ncbi:hypothetical protein JCM5350_003234 [Sporobolomyces pararoseus]
MLSTSENQSTVPSSPGPTATTLPPSTTPSTPNQAQQTKEPVPEAKRSSSGGSSSVESAREDSGGAGNESDDERDPSGSGGQTTREDSDEQLSNLPHHEMYPFPSTSHHQFQRHSSAEVEASSAGSESSDLSSDEEEDEEDQEGDTKMEASKPIAIPKRTLSEYRASLSRAGLAAPPKIRRLGALGISVHSESDIDNPQVSGLDTNDRIDPASGGDTSAGTRETDLGVPYSALQAGNGSGSTTGVVKTPRRRKRVADSTFRGIVDELAIENRLLKDKLRRYEAHGVPLELKDSRLFEIRFYDGLPIDQRTELENFLTGYVRGFVERVPNSSSPPPPQQPSQKPHLPSPLENPSTTLPTSPMQVDGPTSLPSPQASEPPDSKSNAQNLPLAESSNSGVEPFSLSGVGSGVYRPNHAQSFSRASRSFSHPPSLNNPAILTQEHRELAKSVVDSLEQLFRRSLRQNKEEDSQAPSSQRSRSNETYMANFLSHDFLSDGWVYLNLASTMAELHRYSVTLNFVQQAVRDYSGSLEVSQDGKRIRWIGPSPSPSPPPPPTIESDPTTEHKPKPEATSRRAVKIASPAPTDAQGSSGGATTTTQGSLSSNDPSSDNLKGSNFANSIAPTASTAPTSQAPSRSDHSKVPSRPQRPTAAVLQRMDRLSPPTTSAKQPLPPHSPARTSPQETVAPRQLTKAPRPSLSYVAHPESSKRQAPPVYHRLLRNKREDDLEFGGEELVRPGQAIPKGPGMLVFYANGHFCSDLTQEEANPVEVGVEQPFVLGGFDKSIIAESDYSDSLESNIDLDDEVDLLTFEIGSTDGNGSGGEEDQQSSVDSHASSLRRLSVSGMTTTIPADLFTILVKTNHQMTKRPRAQFDEPSSDKKRRLVSHRPRILSSKAYHHRPLMTKRVCPINVDDSSSGDEIPRPHLTASNLAKHTHPTLASITPPLDTDLPRYDLTPSPPHDDYLLSLAAPLHAWAPRETNSNSQSPPVPPRTNNKNRLSIHRRLVNSYPARTNSEMSTTTGDERPISLDDLVGPGMVR